MRGCTNTSKHAYPAVGMRAADALVHASHNAIVRRRMHTTIGNKKTNKKTKSQASTLLTDAFVNLLQALVQDSWQFMLQLLGQHR